MNNSSRSSGFIILDFLFALVLILGLTSILFSLALTLTVASVTQYITYAAARNLYAAHLSLDTQFELTDAKYSALKEHPAFRPLFNNGWFQVAEVPLRGDLTQDFVGLNYENVGQGVQARFIGAATDFRAPILDRAIPFLGETFSDDISQGGGGRFETVIGSYLGRSPSTYECQVFMRQDRRYQAILELESPIGKYGDWISNSSYHLITDNGC